MPCGSLFVSVVIAAVGLMTVLALFRKRPLSPWLVFALAPGGLASLSHLGIPS